mgnify:CR=1 FL=1
MQYSSCLAFVGVVSLAVLSLSFGLLTISARQMNSEYFQHTTEYVAV